MSAEVSGLKDEEKSLKDELSYKKSDDFVVTEARNKLNMVKKGEEIFAKPVVLGIKDESSDNQKPEKRIESNVSLWVKLFL